MARATAIEERIVQTIQLELTEKEAKTLLGVLSKVGGYDGVGGYRDDVNNIHDELYRALGGHSHNVQNEFVLQPMLIHNN